MNKIFILCSLLISTVAVAQSKQDANMKVSAKALAGCQLSGDDFHMGVIVKDYQGIEGNLNISCSKGVELTLTAMSKNNPAGNNGFWMFNKKVTSKKEGLFMPYALKTQSIVDNEFYKVTKRPYLESLNKDFNSVYQHAMKIKVLTDKPAILKFFARVEMDYNNLDIRKVENGEYADTLTYQITF